MSGGWGEPADVDTGARIRIEFIESVLLILIEKSPNRREIVDFMHKYLSDHHDRYYLEEEIAVLAELEKEVKG